MRFDVKAFKTRRRNLRRPVTGNSCSFFIDWAIIKYKDVNVTAHGVGSDHLAKQIEQRPRRGSSVLLQSDECQPRAQESGFALRSGWSALAALLVVCLSHCDHEPKTLTFSYQHLIVATDLVGALCLFLMKGS